VSQELRETANRLDDRAKCLSGRHSTVFRQARVMHQQNATCGPRTMCASKAVHQDRLPARETTLDEFEHRPEERSAGLGVTDLRVALKWR